MPYAAALAAQRRLADARKLGRVAEDHLLLLEHDPVVTVGRGAGKTGVDSPTRLEMRGVPVVEIERGGDVTYHGPGQLVGYPVLDLRRHRRDLHWYLRRLEDALIAVITEGGLHAFRVGGYTGVWVGERGDEPIRGDLEAEEAGPLVAAGSVRKVASIGVHVSRWVTWHGFALNVTDEPLEGFRLIVPCGIPGVRMTSLAAEGLRFESATDPALLEAVARGFARAFEDEVALVDLADVWPDFPEGEPRSDLCVGADATGDGERASPAA